MMNAEAARLPFWHERQILADAKRDDRRAAVLNRFARAVRVQIAVNRLAGFGAPGTGSLLEEARKKGELRHTQRVMAARKLRDTDGEALVLDFARLEEERHEAVAGLASEVAWKTEEQRRQAEKIKKLEREKKELEREKERLQEAHDRLRTRTYHLQDQNYELHEQLRAEKEGVAQKITEVLKKGHLERRAEQRDMRRGMKVLEESNEFLQETNRELVKLTGLMVTGQKRAPDAELELERLQEVELVKRATLWKSAKRAKVVPSLRC
jgi:hypothetical protein